MGRVPLCWLFLWVLRCRGWLLEVDGRGLEWEGCVLSALAVSIALLE